MKEGRHQLYGTYVNWAIELYSSNRNGLLKSATLLDEAIKLVPDDAYVYSQAGSVYYLLKNNGKALEFFTRALDLQPDYVRAYYNLGHCYRALGNKEKAIQSYQTYVLFGERGEEARIERARKLIEELKKE